MAVPEPIDTAYVDIRPDFTGFAAETAAGIKANLKGVAAAGALSGAAATGGAAKGLSKDLDAATRSSTKLTSALKGNQGAVGLLGTTAARSGILAAAGVAGIGVAAVVAGKHVADASIKFDSAFAGVRKAVQAPRAELQALRKDILDLSTEIPVAATELAGIAQSAGQLGVQTSAIKDFTDTVAKLAVTTNLTADTAADSLARIANITQLPQDQFDEMGSTILALGNKLAATEQDVTEFGLRIAGAGKQIGLSNAEILSIGAALSSVGLEAEAGGTAISTTMVKIASAVAKGGAKLQAFADVAGMSADQFRTEFKTKPAEALTAFIRGLGDVGKQGGNVFATLEKLGLGGIRVRDALLRSANAGDLLARSLKIGDTAWKQNTALQQAAATRFDTTASKIQLLKNEATDLEIAVGDKLRPALNEGAGALADLIAGLRGNEQLGTTLSGIFDGIGKGANAVFDVFRDNKETIRDTFGNIATTAQVALKAIKPLAVVVGVTLVVALRVAIPLTEKLTGVVRVMAEVWLAATGKVLTAVDKFLGGLSSLAGAASHIPGIGGKFASAQKGIDTAREHLRAFRDDMTDLNGKHVSVTVDVDTAAAERKIAALATHAKQLQGAVRTDVAPGGQPTFGISPLPKAAPSTKGGKTKGTPEIPAPLTDVPKTLQAKEQRLQDNLAMAQALNDITADDKAALAALAGFYDEQAKNLKLAASIRSDFSVKAAQARQQIRQLDQQDAQAAQDDREARANNAVAVAAATQGTLRDDIEAQRNLIAVLKQRVAVARQSGQGVAAAEGAVAQAERDLTDKLNQRRERRVDIKVTRAQALVKAADATQVNLNDDIRSRQRLVSVLKQRLKVARDTGRDVDTAVSNLRAAQDDLATKIKDVNQEKADRILDAINDRKELASFTQGIADDKAALQAEKRFWQHKVQTLKAGSVERRKALVQLERTKKDLRDLSGQTADQQQGPSVADILTENAKLIAHGGNLGTPGRDPFSGFDINQSLTAMLRRQGGGDPTAEIRHRIDRAPGDEQLKSNDKLITALDRLTQAVTGNGATGVPVGVQNHVAQVAGQRGEAMARFWENRLARQQTEDSTSG